MNEPWETEPETVKKMKELGDRQDEGHKVTISKTWKWNWDDALCSVGNKLLGWIWRK